MKNGSYDFSLKTLFQAIIVSIIFCKYLETEGNLKYLAESKNTDIYEIVMLSRKGQNFKMFTGFRNLHLL